MLKFCKVTKKFSTEFWRPPSLALNGLSFHLQENTLTGFLGANGAGKTTAIKILLNLIFPSSGDVQFTKWNNLEVGKRYQKIGYTPERPYYYPYLNGFEFLTYVGILSGVPKKLLFSRIEEYATTLSIENHLKKRISGYSKGMLQRLGLVAALIHDPELLILDEPTAGIDPLGRKEIKTFLRDLHRKGKTVFVSSHIVSDLEEICSHLIIVDKGTLVYEGTCHDLIETNTGKGHWAILDKEYLSLKELSGKVVKLGEKKYEYYFNTKNSYDFLKECVALKTAPLRFERRVPTLEEIVYNLS